MKRKARAAKRPGPARPRPNKPSEELAERGELILLLDEVTAPPETGPALTGGDLDADWMRAHLSGEEAVGGSVATPDQDVVDEIGRALGVEQAPDAEVRTSREILQVRDRFRWHLDRDASRKEDEQEMKQDEEEMKEEGAA